MNTSLLKAFKDKLEEKKQIKKVPSVKPVPKDITEKRLELFKSRTNKLVNPHFINKSLGTPLLKDYEIHNLEEILPEIPQGFLMPINFILDVDNLTNYFASKDLPLYNKQVVINIINLEERKDRMINFVKYFNNNKIRLERFEAIKKSPGYLGCALSHINCVKKAKEENLPFCVVAEDDFMAFSYQHFEKRLLQLLYFMSENPDKWEVFNSIPVGQNFEFVDKVIDNDLGLVSTIGGLNTSFIIYNHTIYDKVLYLEQYYLEELEYQQHKKKEIYLAWDEICSKYFDMVTCVPFIGAMYSFDSNICETNYKDGYIGNQPLSNFHNIKRWNENNLYKLVNNRFDVNSDVTVCLTSCNRLSELLRTLESFFKYNSYPIRKIIISEDGDYKRTEKRLKEIYKDYFENDLMELIKGGGNQIDSIELLYQKVETEYIYHSENDWMTIKPYFIEQSKAILEADSKCLLVWLRDLNDTNKHPLDRYFNIDGYHCFRLQYGYGKVWNGFTWNPHLFRVSDWRKNLFSDLRDKANGEGCVAEGEISEYYKELKFYCVILPCAYVYHIGYCSSYNPLAKLLN